MSAQSPEFGWDLKDVADMLYVDSDVDDGRIRFEVRAELSCEEMIYLLREMEKVLKKYDRQAYFDMVEPGIAEAFVESEPRKTDDLMRQAIRVLYEMDDYVLSVYDNEGWLMNGVPDGEFTEKSVLSWPETRPIVLGGGAWGVQLRWADKVGLTVSSSD